jgi:hypothetical protein
MLSKRASFVGALALAVAAWAAPASAAELNFDQLIDGGTLSYGGNLGDPLVGTAIRFDTISDGSATLECRGCTLSFSTGGSTFESASFNTYGSGGTFVLTGSAYSGADLDPTTADGSLEASGTLLTGTFTGDQFLIDGGAQLTFNGFGIDSKNQDLLDYFGITDTNFVFANTDISATTGANIRNAFNVNVAEADITNTSVAPEPASLLLFGTVMLGGARAFRRRRLAQA